MPPVVGADHPRRLPEMAIPAAAAQTATPSAAFLLCRPPPPAIHKHRHRLLLDRTIVLAYSVAMAEGERESGTRTRQSGCAPTVHTEVSRCESELERRGYSHTMSLRVSRIMSASVAGVPTRILVKYALPAPLWEPGHHRRRDPLPPCTRLPLAASAPPDAALEIRAALRLSRCTSSSAAVAFTANTSRWTRRKLTTEAAAAPSSSAARLLPKTSSSTPAPAAGAVYGWGERGGIGGGGEQPKRCAADPAATTTEAKSEFDFESSLEAIVLLQRSVLDKQWKLPFEDDVSSAENNDDKEAREKSLSKAVVVAAEDERGVARAEERSIVPCETEGTILVPYISIAAVLLVVVTTCAAQSREAPCRSSLHSRPPPRFVR